MDAHELKITAQPAFENPSMLIIDIHHKKMGGQYMCKQTSWMIKAGDDDVVSAVVEALKAAWAEGFPVKS